VNFSTTKTPNTPDQIEEALRPVCNREGFAVRRFPVEHAGGKWFLRYESAIGKGEDLEIDLNFMFRTPCGQLRGQLL
jgi:hypothetical protein